MTRRRTILALLSVGVVLGGGGLPAAAAPAPKHGAAMRTLDPNGDGAIDLAEARKVAAALFDRIDHNKDGLLNKRELGGRVTPQEFAVADRNRDGKLSKEEYLSVVESRFKAADPNNTGKVSERELFSRAGRPLARLLLP
jgi:Ca2+-binding EF-hand superfamily protein